ncbi:unnamed protein product, partial [marine sediment metagenome]
DLVLSCSQGEELARLYKWAAEEHRKKLLSERVESAAQ